MTKPSEGKLILNNNGSELKSQKYNWPRSSSANNGKLNKFSIYSSNLNSRWNFLNPSNISKNIPDLHQPEVCQNDSCI